MQRTIRYALITVLGAMAMVPALAQDNFPDVPSNHWAVRALEELKRDGILVGYPDGLFRGGRPASRYELAVAIHAAYTRLMSMQNGLAEQLRQLNERMGSAQGGDLTEIRNQIAELQRQAEATRNLGDRIATLERLGEEFRRELASMGVDVQQMKRDLADVQRRLGVVEGKLPAVDISGDANLLVLAGHGDDNNFGLTPDLRITGFGKDGLFGAPVGITRDLSIYHEAAFTFRGNNEEGPKWMATLVAGNMLSQPTVGAPNALGNQSQPSVLSPFQEGAGDVYFQNFAVMFDTSLVGLGFSAEIGRIGYQISPYVLKRTDYTTYFKNPRWDSGNHTFDGAIVKFKFGGANLHVFGGRNSDRNSVNGVDLNPIRRFGADSTGANRSNESLVDQTLGVRLNLPISDIGAVNLSYLWLDSNTASTTLVDEGFARRAHNRTNVIGGDVNLTFGKIDVTGFYTQTPYTYNTTRALDDDNKAYGATIGYTGNNFGVSVGARRVESFFGAPGSWGRLGTLWNPTNIESASAGVYFQVNPEFRISARGESAREVNDLNVNGRRDKIDSIAAQIDYRMPTGWSLMASYENVRFDADIRGAAQAKQDWFTFGLGYSLGADAKLDIMYQTSDLRNMLNSYRTSFGGNRYRGGLISTQLSIKF